MVRTVASLGARLFRRCTDECLLFQQQQQQTIKTNGARQRPSQSPQRRTTEKFPNFLALQLYWRKKTAKSKVRDASSSNKKKKFPVPHGTLKQIINRLQGPLLENDLRRGQEKDGVCGVAAHHFQLIKSR